MNDQPASASECALLVFELAGQTFAADPHDIRRLDRIQPFMPLVELLPTESKRVIVAASEGGEFQVPVDVVQGVRHFARSALRRPPVLAQQVGGPRANELMGVVLDEGRPLLIVDLKALSARADRPAQS